MRENRCRKNSPKPRSFGQFACMSLLALSFLGAKNCQPSGPEAAGAVLIVSPFAFLGGLFVLRILYWIWKPMIQSAPFFQKSFAIMFGGLLVLAPIAHVAVPGASEWAEVALWVFGTSYLSVLLLVWRIWLFKKSETAFSRAPIAATIGILSPVPIFLLVPFSHEFTNGLTTILWMLPGFFGYVTFPLFMMAVSEAIARRIFPKESPPKVGTTSQGS